MNALQTDLDAFYENRICELRVLGRRMWAHETSTINLIASDNAYPAECSEYPVYRGHIVQEGLPGRRPFAGAEFHDELENLAVAIACKVFGAQHANLQPHSCSQANQAVYHALLSPGDMVMALDFRTGGHLTHGMKTNFSGRHFQFCFYGVDASGSIDYEHAKSLALLNRPKLIICGSSSYPRLFDAVALRAIADSVGAKLMFDLSHEAGLIAGGAIPNIVSYADVTTMSIDKTLRGPFGSIILCRKEFAEKIDKAVHPGTQSSFSVRKIASIAQALALTQTKEFQIYTENVLGNAKILAKHFRSDLLFSGGTDKHYIVIDTHRGFGLAGAEAEAKLSKLNILTSRQSLPTDTSSKMSAAGGLRIGTAWASSRGYTANDFIQLSEILIRGLEIDENSTEFRGLSKKVLELAKRERTNDVWASLL